MKRAVTGFVVTIGWLVFAAPVTAQSWRLRFDANAQRVEFRGVTADSTLESATVTNANGGRETVDGYAVTCGFDAFCRYYRAGAIREGLPASAGVDMAMWGFGVRGLSMRLSARSLGDLTGDRLWPGTSPTMRLIEGYAEFLHDGLTARAGRMLEQGRLASTGSSGLDGLRATWQSQANRFEVGGYAGWGLARGTILPVTSPAVNPLVDYQPSERQVVVGALAGLHLRAMDAQAEYRRELDPVTDYIVAERAALSLQVRPASRLRLVSGVDYDIAQGLLGTADASLSYTGGHLWATVGARHYRPFFDLWTVWGVFSPVGYNGVNASLAFNPVTKVQLRARGEWFKYDDADVSTPAVTLENKGYRWGVDASYNPAPKWTIDAGGHGEFLPGASSKGIDGRVTWRMKPRLDLAVNGGSLERPLELRFQDAGVKYAGGSADYHIADRWRFGLSVDRYWESRKRPDALSFDWNQWRVSARVSLTLKSSADDWALPPARRTP